MNRKNKITIGILLALGTLICAGCAAGQERKYTPEDLDNLAEIRIYAAQNDALIKTVSDEEQLYQYNHCPVFEDWDMEHQEEWEKALEGAIEQYHLVSYKYPAARFGEKELEKNHTLTLYEDSNIIKMTVAQESVKAISLPEEFLTFYEEISDEEMDFYRSLAE